MFPEKREEAMSQHIIRKLDQSVFVIAEAGVNHNGDIGQARALIDVAVECGADAVKFQTFDPSSLVTQEAPKAAYQKVLTNASESQFAMLQKLQLSKAAHFELRDHAASRGILFMSTPFDIGSLCFLVDELGLSTIKLSSAEVTNGPLLAAAARKDVGLILSTGMSSLNEVVEALDMLAEEMCENTYLGTDDLRNRLALLHCTSQYPAPPEDINLRAIRSLSEATGLHVGLSDHSDTTCIPTSAVAAGARIIEKHFTLDRNLPGPDHKASAEPSELRRIISDIRIIDAALGNGVKACMTSELENRKIVRRSLVAARPISAGDVLSEENLIAKRPGDGISPMQFRELYGQRATRDYKVDEKIETID